MSEHHHAPVHHAVLLQLPQRSRREKDPEVSREGRQQVQPGQSPAEVHAGPRLLVVQLHPPHRSERAQEEPQPGLNLACSVLTRVLSHYGLRVSILSTNPAMFEFFHVS